jgi:hypothetical protein
MNDNKVLTLIRATVLIAVLAAIGAGWIASANNPNPYTSYLFYFLVALCGSIVATLLKLLSGSSSASEPPRKGR